MAPRIHQAAATALLYSGMPIVEGQRHSTDADTNFTEKLIPEFASMRLPLKEAAAWDTDCACSQRVEARRAALHASLDRVLVIDTLTARPLHLL